MIHLSAGTHQRGTDSNFDEKKDSRLDRDLDPVYGSDYIWGWGQF